MSLQLMTGQRLEQAPKVSVITTVYDRVECLRRCLRAMQHSQWTDWEQIIVSDCPGQKVEGQITTLVRGQDDPRVRYLARASRANDWGIAPATDGLHESQGEYVCFLSDDNAFLPDHLARLVPALDADPTLGFVYSSCLYAGRRVLRVAPPKPAQIDLGQPLFRRSVLRDVVHDTIPYKLHAWDWHLIQHLMQHGVRWQHLDTPSFIFKLAAYPNLMEALA